MKKVVLFFALVLATTFNVFARGSFPIETVELCFAFGTEDYIKNTINPDYEIVKTHLSDKGAKSLNLEQIRDIQITKNINGKSKEVCYIYPYYEGQEPTDLKARLPMKMILDNRQKDFEKNKEDFITICFAIETDDTELLNFLMQLKKNDCLNAIQKRMAKDHYIDYYNIRDKIKIE